MYFIVGEVYDSNNQKIGYRYVDELLRLCYMSKDCLLERLKRGIIKLHNANLNIMGDDIEIKGVQHKDIPKIYRNGEYYIPQGERTNLVVIGRYPNHFYLCHIYNIVTIFPEKTLVEWYKAGHTGFMNVRLVKGTFVSKAGTLLDITSNGTGYIYIDGYICVRPRYVEYHSGPFEPSESILAETKQKCPTLVLHPNIQFVALAAFKDFKIPFKVKSKGNCILKAFSFKNSGVKVLQGNYKEICHNAFDSSDIEAVDCSTTEIGNEAFTYCKSLQYVKVNRNLQKIGNFSFASSTINTLKASTCRYVGRGAFENCTSLERVELGYGTCLSENAFFNTPNLVCFNGTIEKLGIRAFFNSGIKGLEGIFECDIPPLCFAYSKLMAITLGTVDIGKQAFYDCKDLIGVTFNTEMLLNIGEEAFFNTGVGQIKLVVRQGVGASAFENCRNLERVVLTLPTAKALGDRAFAKCKDLETVILYTRDNSTNFNYHSIFKDCPKLKSITINGKDIAI